MTMGKTIVACTLVALGLTLTGCKPTALEVTPTAMTLTAASPKATLTVKNPNNFDVFFSPDFYAEDGSNYSSDLYNALTVGIPDSMILAASTTIQVPVECVKFDKAIKGKLDFYAAKKNNIFIMTVLPGFLIELVDSLVISESVLVDVTIQP